MVCIYGVAARTAQSSLPTSPRTAMGESPVARRCALPRTDPADDGQVSPAPPDTNTRQPAHSARTTAKRESSSSAASRPTPGLARSACTPSVSAAGTSSTGRCVSRAAILHGDRNMSRRRRGSLASYVVLPCFRPRAMADASRQRCTTRRTTSWSAPIHSSRARSYRSTRRRSGSGTSRMSVLCLSLLFGAASDAR